MQRVTLPRCIADTTAWAPTQPVATRPLAIQWSSEFHDPELGMVYYNWRYYNPKIGKWNQYDKLYDDYNNYLFSSNLPVLISDILGNKGFVKVFS